jgi:pimeloyl-ACP methyl ester carboxylesterase
MKLFDQGTGTPIVVIPGIQGRWEWMRPALNALARRYRTISYSLCGDLGSGARMDASIGFDSFLRQLDGVLDRAGLDRAVLCGVSYGGVIAVRYAARRPQRVSHLILVSTPGPHWKPSARQAAYAERPWSSLPAFLVTAFDRLGAELKSALPQWRTRANFTSRYLASALLAPMMPHLMGSRVKLQLALDLDEDCARIQVPTLVVTGEAPLDRVVPVESTREYLASIRGARYAMMDGTGHLGMLTQPERFVEIVSDFIDARDS